LELVPGQEVVIHSVHFPGTDRPGGCRDRVPEIVPALQQPLGDGGLPAAGGGGEHQEKRLHCRFSSCSRNFSSSPFMAMTCCVLAASAALAPMVFTSLPSSWARNPSCFPDALAACSASSQAARCARNRTSSSVMSSLSARNASSCAIRGSSAVRPSS